MKTAIKRANNVEQTLADSWQIISLEMDEAGKELGDYFKKLAKNLKRVSLSARLHTKDELAEKIGEIVVPGRRTLAVYGAGRFHHYTYGLCKAADRLSDNYSYIHFDHHNDYGCNSYQRAVLSCGSFVRDILLDTHAQSVFFIGSHVPNERGQFENFLTKSGKGCKINSLEEVLEKTPNEVYLSFDLDVMHPGEILTGFSRGEMLADMLLELIAAIKQEKRIIGTDILGYYSCMGAYVPNESIQKSMQLYHRIAEAILPEGYFSTHAEIKDKPTPEKSIRRLFYFFGMKPPNPTTL